MTRDAFKLAYRIAREFKKLSPWDFSDIEAYNPDYLRTWTQEILSGNVRFMIRDCMQSEATMYLVDQLRAYEN